MAAQDGKGDHAFRKLMQDERYSRVHARRKAGGKGDRVNDAINQGMDGDSQNRRDGGDAAPTRTFGKECAERVVQDQAAKKAGQHEVRCPGACREGFRGDVQKGERDKHAGGSEADDG